MHVENKSKKKRKDTEFYFSLENRKINIILLMVLTVQENSKKTTQRHLFTRYAY